MFTCVSNMWDHTVLPTQAKVTLCDPICHGKLHPVALSCSFIKSSTLLNLTSLKSNMMHISDENILSKMSSNFAPRFQVD